MNAITPFFEMDAMAISDITVVNFLESHASSYVSLGLGMVSFRFRGCKSL